MNKSLFVAALMGCTALGSPAKAAPAVAFVQGAVAAFAGSAVIGGSVAAAGFTAGVAFGASAVGGLIIKAAVLGLASAALNKVMSTGLPKITADLSNVSSASPADRMANFAQALAPVEWVYGIVRKGGPLGFTGFAYSRRWYVPILAGHPIDGVEQWYLDEWQVGRATSQDGNWLEANILNPSPAYSYGRVDLLNGDHTSYHPGLNGRFPELTSAHDFKGLAVVVAWAKRPPADEFTTVYPTGGQWAITPVFRGHNAIYDPRTDTTGYSNNAALVIAHWLTEWGHEVDWTEVAAEADICDETVTNLDGGTQARWTLNGTLDESMEWEDQRAMLAAACDCFFYERTDGKTGFKVGRWIEPTVTLTAEDFLSIQIKRGQYGADRVSEVAPIYVEPDNAWRETSAGSWVEDAANKQVRDEPKLYFCNSHNQASRVAKRMAKSKRAAFQISGTITGMGYELIGQRFFRVVLPEFGVDDYFEIGELTHTGLFNFTFTANSVLESDFAFDAAAEEPTPPSRSTVTNSDEVPAVVTLDATATAGGALDFTWSEEGGDTYLREIQLKRTDETDWQRHYVPDGQGTLRVTGLVDQATYEAQIRLRSGAGRTGEWSPATPITAVVVADANPPAALDAFNAVLDGVDVDVTLTAPNSGNYYATRIYRAADSTDFANASLVHTEYGPRANPDSWTDTDPAADYGTAPTELMYWGIPINSSGQEGPASGPVTVTL